ncbi:retrovirus-related Pol polyprotein from transposon 297 [Trichonephila clavipes]|nr:retrovirus-related Pol polyprotein from transposon 297 [Trichonephila clavipes]
MQNMMELNFLVGKKKFITVLDMLKGYWSIPMEDSSKHLTAFRTHRGQYQWNVLPFGLRNVAATYQRAMSKVVRTISDFACAYIDDLAIFSETWEEHLNHLEEVSKRSEHFNFSVNLGKCEFARQKVKYLGHVIGSGRHSTDKERIKAIQNLQAPTTKKQLRSALGFTKKKVPNEIPWSKEAENAFKELKTTLCRITELQVPDIEKPYYLHTDASQTAVGCCLGQLDGEDNIHPIAFGSQKLNPSQQKRSTIEREVYAIIWALKRFETLLCGAKIFLLTDHNHLVLLTSAAPQRPRLQSLLDQCRHRTTIVFGYLGWWPDRVTHYEQAYPYTIIFEPNYGVHIPRSFGKTVIVFTSHLDLTWDKRVDLRFFQVGRPSHRVWDVYQPQNMDAYILEFTDCTRVADVYLKWLTCLDD